MAVPMYMNKVMLMDYLAHDAEGRTSRDGRPYTPVRVSDCRPHRLRDTVAVRKSPAGFQLEDVSRLLEHSSVRVSHVCGAALIAANRFLRVRPEDQGSLHRTDALAARRKAAPGRRVGVDLSSMASSFNLFDPGLEWCFPGPRNLAKAMRLPGELSRNSTPITGDWRAAYPE